MRQRLVSFVRGRAQDLRQWATRMRQRLLSFIRGKVNALRDWADKLRDRLLSFIRGKVNALRDWADKLRNRLLGFIRGKVNALRDWASKLRDRLLGFIRGKVVALRDWAAKLRENLLNFIRDKVNALRDWASRMRDALLAWLVDKVYWLRDWAARTIENFWNEVSNRNPILTWISTMMGGIRDFLEAWGGDWLVSLGEAIFAGLITGVSKNGQSFVDKIGEYMKKAIDKVWEYVNPGSPSRVTRPLGASLMDGLRAGVESQGQLAVRAVDNNMARMVASVHRGADAMRGTRMDLPAARAQTMAQIDARRRVAQSAHASRAPHRQPRSLAVQATPTGHTSHTDKRDINLNVHVTSDGNGGVNMRELEGSLYDIVEDVLGGYG
jgi:hypothetical protein